MIEPAAALSRNSDPDTSHEAAAVVNVTKLHMVILKKLFGNPTYGLTTSDIAHISSIPRDSLSPRMKLLVELELIVDSTERRKPAIPDDGRRHPKQIVWKITEKGVKYVA